jgi:hypothetical protein
MEAAEKNSPSMFSSLDIWVAVGIMGCHDHVSSRYATMMLDIALCH